MRGRTLAREYAADQPSLIRIGVAVERHAGGGQTVRTLSILPALVGAWRKPGGGILQLPLWAFPVNWPAFLHPELLTPGKRIVNQPGQMIDPLPHYIPPRESTRTNPHMAERFPLNLLTPKRHAYLNSSFANHDFHRKAQKEPNLIMHPDDAAACGISDGRPVRVFNDHGEFVVIAKVSPTMLQGVVVSALGGWRKHAKSASPIRRWTRRASRPRAPSRSATCTSSSAPPGSRSPTTSASVGCRECGRTCAVPTWPC